jgi:hypothetical protein
MSVELVGPEEEEQIREEHAKQAEHTRRMELVNASAAFRNQLEALNVAANMVLEFGNDAERYQLPMGLETARAIVGLNTRFGDLHEMIDNEMG